MIPHGNIFACRTIFSHKRNAEGNIIGQAHDNPILDSHIYDIEISDSEVTTLMANAIAKAMYAKCDLDGNNYILLDELIDVKWTDDALTLDQQQITVNGTTHQRKSTKVGSCAADGKTAPSPGKICQISKSPILSSSLSLQSEWECCRTQFQLASVLCPQEERRYHLARETLQHQVPEEDTQVWPPLSKLVDDALAIDRHSGSTLWVDAIVKEMENIRVAFNALEDDRNVPHGVQFVECHIIFDIKMEDFCCKACLVAGRHMTNVPAMYTYASVVTCETVHIALMLAALKSLKVMAANIMNTYITAPCKEKIWNTLGSELGKDYTRLWGPHVYH